MGATHSAVLAIVLLLAASSTSAAARPASSNWDLRARTLMNEGKLAEASDIVEAKLAQSPKDIQARFLKGLILVADGNYRQAIRLFRSILVDEPKAQRVRLELARAFYLAKDYPNATRQFQFVLAADPPEGVAANVRRYLASIRQAKDFSYNFTSSVAPDSNLNAGSSAREVTLFGLPFDLSEDTRKRSGVGLSVEGGVEWAPSIGKGRRLRLGLYAQRREFRASTFDDTILTGYAGPRVVAGKWDISLLGTAYGRWYGARPYSHAAGARLESTFHATPRLELSESLGVQSIRYPYQSHRNGHLVSASGSAFYALSTISAATAKAGISREEARQRAFSSWSGFLAAGYFRELPLGFSAYIEPSASFARYDRALLAFGRKRRDSTLSVMIVGLNRHIVLGRFTPRISYTFTRQDSSIALYDFTRNRVEVGLTTAF